MADLGAYLLKDLNIGENKPKYSFTDAYIEEIYESENVCNATERLRAILYTKHEKADLQKVMENKCQHLKKHNVMIYQNYYRNSKICSMEHLQPGKQIQ